MAGQGHVTVGTCFSSGIHPSLLTSPRWRWQSDRYVTLKLAVSNSNEYNANREVGITKFLEADPSHECFRFVRTMIDNFEIRGPHGTHQCSVYEPMRETMAQFQQRLPGGKIPGLLLKEYMKHLLLALDYIHSTCNVVHTGEETRSI